MQCQQGFIESETKEMNIWVETRKTKRKANFSNARKICYLRSVADPGTRPPPPHNWIDCDFL